MGASILRNDSFTEAILRCSGMETIGTENWLNPLVEQSLLLFSHSVMTNSLQPNGLQHTRLRVLHHLPELAQTHVHWVNDAIQLSRPLLPLLFLPSIFPSIRVFYNESTLHIKWPKYWSFSFSISPFNKYSGLISFRID